MARVNVYLPDELAQEVKAAGVNVSQIAQQALRHELARGRVSAWLDGVSRLRPTGISHEKAMSALREAREELAGDGD